VRSHRHFVHSIHNLALINTHVVTKPHVQEFVPGQSATHQISHTKGFVADGKVAGEGSANWSDSGASSATSDHLRGISDPTGLPIK
jgi:phosphatidylserine/phosphatidylglycerophosphate/cardiolipin synthase-like enzyme